MPSNLVFISHARQQNNGPASTLFTLLSKSIDKSSIVLDEASTREEDDDSWRKTKDALQSTKVGMPQLHTQTI
jgi:hypothetical protein